MKNLKAVITADIVNSSQLGKAEFNRLLKAIELQVNTAGNEFGFYRGDSFHAMCDVSSALKIACLARTLAIPFSRNTENKRIDIRMTIGIGTVDEPVYELGTAKGEAFTLSGREMDKMEKTGPRLSIRCTNELADTGFSAIAMFVDYILNKMTVRQAEIVYLLLQDFTQTDVAKNLKKRQSTVSKHAAAADWKALLRLIKIYAILAGKL